MVNLPRVLFVDDDADVLGGLSNALRKYRSRYDLVFVLGGPAGVEEARRATFDVVITDMRMPEIDGASLLLQVRDHDPTTFRMILSGYADENSVTRALPVAHQFVDKPCNFKELIAVIDRACSLRAMFGSAPMRALIDRLAHVASPADTAPDPDLAASARILRLAASVFLGTEPVPTGPQSGAAIALAAFAVARIAEPIPGYSLEAHERRSSEVAERARAAVVPALAAHAFTAGLVHDIGRLIMSLGLPEAIDVGVTHAQLGAYVLTLWGAPFAVIDAVASVGDDVADPSPLTVALRAALAT